MKLQSGLKIQKNGVKNSSETCTGKEREDAVMVPQNALFLEDNRFASLDND